MISLQTNVDSLNAQNNLGVDNKFQSKTIQQLTSGYRINSSGDDAAGLAIANGLRSSVAELTQGVANANDGVSQLQIVDGGLSNISTILDRLKTLATQSASGTFTGDRATLNQEYQGLISEITRQATNINLQSGGTFNAALNVYIGGGSKASNASVSIDLSGTKNAVDANSLGLVGTDVLGGTVGGVGFGSNTVRLDNPATKFLTAGTQTYTFNYTDSTGSSQARNVVLSGGASGIDGNTVISQLNSGLAGTGVTASINATNGTVQFTSAGAFAIGVTAATAGTDTVTAAATAVNTSQYNLTHAFTAVTAGSESFTIGDGTHSAAITLSTVTGATIASAVNSINAQLKAANVTGVSALATGDNTGITFQGASNFNATEYTLATTGGVFTALGNQAVTAPTAGGTAGTDATAAINTINAAIKALGLVQGSVGAGENKLQYAISLAQSQISGFSAAEAQIRDTDVAAAAANLTKAQVLTQTSIAALAQANSEPQSVLKLLQG
jgi:flagellin